MIKQNCDPELWFPPPRCFISWGCISSGYRLYCITLFYLCICHTLQVCLVWGYLVSARLFRVPLAKLEKKKGGRVRERPTAGGRVVLWRRVGRGGHSILVLRALEHGDTGAARQREDRRQEGGRVCRQAGLILRNSRIVCRRNPFVVCIVCPPQAPKFLRPPIPSRWTSNKADEIVCRFCNFETSLDCIVCHVPKSIARFAPLPVCGIYRRCNTYKAVCDRRPCDTDGNKFAPPPKVRWSPEKVTAQKSLPYMSRFVRTTK